MKYILFITCSCLLFSCSDSFINHELKYERVGDCSNINQPVKMISNINGERYEFFCCMDDDFDGKNYTVKRSGDSIIVDFPRSAKKQASYQLTLDIDAKPAYHYIILDGKGITIVPKNM